MKPIEFKEQNKILTAPKGQEETCGSLPTYSDGQQSVSCWEVADAEYEQIKLHRKIWLGVLAGNSQPPVWLSGINPFEVNTDADRKELIGKLVGSEIPVQSWGLSTRLNILNVDEIEFEYILQTCIKSKSSLQIDLRETVQTNSELVLMTQDFGIMIIRKNL
jgi:hypothetical protein